MAVLEANVVPKTRENMKTTNKNAKTNNKKVLVVAQELKLARVLAGNNKTNRDRALRSLIKWFKQRSETIPFTEDDFLRIWKGLFYSMWMSDKPLIQEECAENISKLVHFPSLDPSLLFFKAGLQTLCNEWFGIDQLRLDKFLMFTRRLLRQILIVLRNNRFSKKSVDQFSNILSMTVLNIDKKPPMALFMHFTEIFLEELAKISNGSLNPDRVTDFLRPFIARLAASSDGREIAHIRKFIFTYLLRQSDLGLEYQEKYNAWKKEGFPGSINSMKKVPLEDDEKMSSDEEEQDDDRDRPMDPRAGRVDVELPQIKFHPKAIAKALLEVKFDKRSTTKARKMITILAEQFQKLARGVYPLGVKQITLPTKEDCDTNIKKAVNRLVKFEKKLMGRDKKRKRNNGDAGETERKKPKLDEELEDTETDESSDTETDRNGELEDFIRRSEGHLEKKNGDRKLKREMKRNYEVGTPLRKTFKKAKSDLLTNRKYAEKAEFVFTRNSGTWFVHKEIDADESTPYPSVQDNSGLWSVRNDDDFNKSNADLGSFLELKLKEKKSPGKRKSLEKSSAGKSFIKSPRQGKMSPDKNVEDGTPKLNPVKLFSSPKSEKKEIFPKSEWEEPLKEGEYEICVPSKKYVGKLKKEAKKQNQSVQELITDTIQRIRGKNRMSLDSRTVKNPFSKSKTSTPNSSKKVKINVKLNQSQEVHEHVAQILSSPGIPYDANRKPSKPLLKTVGTTPINPFYRSRK